MSASGPLLVSCDGLIVKMLLQNVTQVCIPNHVRELENDCFRYCGNLSHVTYAEPSLVQKVKKIGRRAFSRTSIASIAVPDSVEVIGDGCFYFCQKLTSVQFGQNSRLGSIGPLAFSRSGLQRCELPATVVHVGGSAFSECPIAEAGLVCANRRFKIDGDFLLNARGALICCLLQFVEEIIVPISVTEISDWCFSHCGNLSSVIIPLSLRRIGTGAFYRSGIEAIEIPPGITEIPEMCFSLCTKMSIVEFAEPSGVKVLGTKAFMKTTRYRGELRLCRLLFQQVLCKQLCEPSR